MKVVILNGSPKGNKSVTMNYINYLEKKFTDHEFNCINIAQRITKIEKDEAIFDEILSEIESSDIVLWAFPLYVCLVHSNYKRFIELIFEKKKQHVFSGKYTAIFSTSIHFFDHTAHNYMEGICNDLKMHVVDKYSAEMHDLFHEKERKNFECFAHQLFEAVSNKVECVDVFKPIEKSNFVFEPGKINNKIDIGDKKIVVVADIKDENSNLSKMVNSFTGQFSKQIDVFNLNDIGMTGGCLGCIRCGWDNNCAYNGKDGFIEFYNEHIKTADIIVYAGEIVDRYLSSEWKKYFDRRFFNTHSPTITGKQIGYIVSGPLSQLPNLRQILETNGEWEMANKIGIVCDDSCDSEKIDQEIRTFARNAIAYADMNYIRPKTFLGVGGIKIFRDEMFANLRFPFRADHKFYKKNGIYDFPQKKTKARAASMALTLLCTIPSIRKVIYEKELINKMVEPFENLLKKV